MSKQSKPIRQEYITKIRYTNNLPPPPLNPKFLQYNLTENVTPKQEAEYLMSSLFRKENFRGLIDNVDEELGMNLNLINNRGFLDDGNDSVIYNMVKSEQDGVKSEKPVSVKLHPKDRILLRDAGIGKISKSEPGVSFLRRTEYIADKDPVKNASSTLDQNNKKSTEERHDANSQLQAVESSFEKAQETLTNFATLKHPRKKHLTAVDAWPLLPDTSMMDTKFLTVKFIGSASVDRETELARRQEGSKFNEKFHRDALESAIFKPITSADGEWISLYQVRDPKKASELNEKLHSTERERPVNLLDEDDNTLEEYRFKHTKNYEMNFQRFTKPNEELSIKFIPEEVEGTKKRKVAYYYPVTGRIDLKKHRASTNSEVNRFLKDTTIDAINFKLREPNTSELKKMDAIRSEFDPMEYEGEEEEEEEEKDIGDEFNEASKSLEA
ncbi:DNA-directed RNA polymerase II regulator [Suhomyces tanzawaensis NRRL Y-17324]|uniref:DNA-directed RNA polymerase II regulator n=1 Tax=Suhomyces tanzawaensis NRRL Y-17324 TaxID=984487 RepID=A0A1E4SNR8_9ASCO|nr:DNA-directed RNA polymerase II regulator [Suhomyces tanzawaensis NRRL Y-17324]ODV81136.1 DNA-directed RNA polymerase II regulator [Suhomyces tanzawaensis NRRL Y-17324]